MRKIPRLIILQVTFSGGMIKFAIIHYLDISLSITRSLLNQIGAAFLLIVLSPMNRCARLKGWIFDAPIDDENTRN